jgi:hypothetical protein
MGAFPIERFNSSSLQTSLAVARKLGNWQIELRGARFFLTFHFTFYWEKPWPMPRTNTPKT